MMFSSVISCIIVPEYIYQCQRIANIARGCPKVVKDVIQKQRISNTARGFKTVPKDFQQYPRIPNAARECPTVPQDIKQCQMITNGYGWFEILAIGGVSTVPTNSDQVGHLQPTWSFKTNLFIFDHFC